MTKEDKLFQIEIPASVRSSLVESVESGEFPSWLYPKTVDESLEEYVEARRGRFDGAGFEVFPDEKCASVNRSNVELVPETLREAINSERRSVFREEYTIRFEFESEAWDSVEDVWLDAYWVMDVL